MQTPEKKSTKKKWQKRIITYLLITFVHTYRFLLRIEVRDKQGLLKGEGAMDSVIFTLWHDRLLLFALALTKHKIPSNHLIAMASPSKAGDVGADVFTTVNVESIRGSNKRGAKVALKEMHNTLNQNINMLIAPDGSQGPAFVVKRGLVRLAQTTNKKIHPINIYASNVWRLKNIWDHHVIPKPFSRIIIEVSNEIAPLELNADRSKYSEQQSYIAEKIISDINIPESYSSS